MNIHMYTYIHIHTFMCIHIDVSKFITYTHICRYIYVYIYIYMQRHTCVYWYSFRIYGSGFPGLQGGVAGFGVESRHSCLETSAVPKMKYGPYNGPYTPDFGITALVLGTLEVQVRLMYSCLQESRLCLRNVHEASVIAKAFPR